MQHRISQHLGDRISDATVCIGGSPGGFKGGPLCFQFGGSGHYKIAYYQREIHTKRCSHNLSRGESGAVFPGHFQQVGKEVGGLIIEFAKFMLMR